MKNRGVWETYVPDEIPFGMPANALFWQRQSDGADLYAWRQLFYEFVKGADTSGTTKVAVVDGFASCISADVSMLSLPSQFELIELEDSDAVPQLGWLLVDGEFQPPIVPEPVTTVYAVDFWTRLDGGEDGNSGEVAQVLAAMEQQPIKTRKIFDTANSFRSDHELWPLLQQLATSLFGEERADEILAPSA
ncbi:hypothetical protein [Rhizobium sp.]|uniref:hypothetical protein n=1 Tax=Rhizobium sp. TaxID=391 RepID=UPI0028A63B55